MGESEQFVAMPKRVVESEFGAGPGPGRGRVKIDWSISASNVIAALVIIVALALFGMNMNSQLQDLTRDTAQMKAATMLNEARMTRMEQDIRSTRQDLRNFPLHRHVGNSRVDIYPIPRVLSEDEN